MSLPLFVFSPDFRCKAVGRPDFVVPGVQVTGTNTVFCGQEQVGGTILGLVVVLVVVDAVVVLGMVVVVEAMVLVEVEGVLELVGNVGHVIVTGGAAAVVVFVVFVVDEDDDDDEEEGDTDGWIGSITGNI